MTLNVLYISLLLAAALVTGSTISSDRELVAPFMENMKLKGYPALEYEFATDDGYLLTAFRIQAKGETIKSGKQPVILQHGMDDSADVLVVNDENLAVGLVLANAGYDVWFGNSRGNKYSTKHASLNPDKNKKYWEFSFQQMAEFDLPALFTLVNKVTGFSQIHYIGHSQGTTQMFAALADKNPIMSKYLGKFIAIAPITSLKNIKNVLTRVGTVLIPFSSIIMKVGRLSRYKETSGLKHAESCLKHPKRCAFSNRLTTDGDLSALNIKRFPYYKGHTPGGVSAGCMIHYCQLIAEKEGKFRKFSYGKSKNLKVYGTEDAPAYNLSNIQHPIWLFVGSKDLLATEKDAQILKGQLKSAQMKVYPEGHMSLLLGWRTEQVSDILAILSQKALIKHL